MADRLEEAGYVRRERDPSDRRRVVIRLVLDRALKDVAPVFLPLVLGWQGVVTRYTDDELRLIVEFYGQMEQVIRDHLARLRAPAEPSGPPPAAPGASGGPGASAGRGLTEPDGLTEPGGLAEPGGLPEPEGLAEPDGLAEPGGI